MALSLLIPLVYNSCQAGLLSSKGFMSARSQTQCKAGLYKGEVTPFEAFAKHTPFSERKVILDTLPQGLSTQSQKTLESDSTLPPGAELGVLALNSCPSEWIGSLSEQKLEALERQIYAWNLDREYSISEIEALADADPCVIGLSWNQSYRLHAFNDSQSINQSHLEAINASAAYSLAYGESAGMKRTGDPVIMAVIDTGVDYAHLDLQANMWRHNQGIGIDITTLGGNVDYNPTDPSAIGHGTHVAGIIAAASDNTIGITGTMPFRGQIMSIKVFETDPLTGEEFTSSQHVYNAIQFAYLNGAHVINLSLGRIVNGSATDALAETALTEAVNRGVTVITVIGNSDPGENGREVNGTTLTSIPAIYSTKAGVIGVGSFDVRTGQKSLFSHFSTTYAEIGAPGAEQGLTGIYSTLPTRLSSYGRLAGTSQAGPQVTAAAGLTIGLIREAYKIAPTPQEVERLLLASAAKSQDLAPFFKDGNRLDLHRLVQKINEEYPLTKGAQSTDLSSFGCP